MNTGQMMLTLGAMAILSMTTLRVNRHFVDSGISLDETKFIVLAVSLASSVIEEANSKAFDESTTDGSVNSITPLSSVAGLGPEAGETYGSFDDCDDYHNYQRTVDSIPSANFNVLCTVKYIEPSTPNVDATVKTFFKRITVRVTSPSMKDTISMSSISSYWYFR